MDRACPECGEAVVADATEVRYYGPPFGSEGAVFHRSCIRVWNRREIVEAQKKHGTYELYERLGELQGRLYELSSTDAWFTDEVRGEVRKISGRMGAIQKKINAIERPLRRELDEQQRTIR